LKLYYKKWNSKRTGESLLETSRSRKVGKTFISVNDCVRGRTTMHDVPPPNNDFEIKSAFPFLGT
jgi:hypothetical protein